MPTSDEGEPFGGAVEPLADGCLDVVAQRGVGPGDQLTEDQSRAITCYQRAVEIFQDLGDRPNLAGPLTRLGDAYQAAGDLGNARITWQRALAILDDLHHRNASQIRAKLRPLGPAP